jgi:hypothetical protein
MLMPQACNCVKYLYQWNNAMKKTISIWDSALHSFIT